MRPGGRPGCVSPAVMRAHERCPDSAVEYPVDGTGKATGAYCTNCGVTWPLSTTTNAAGKTIVLGYLTPPFIDRRRRAVS